MSSQCPNGKVSFTNFLYKSGLIDETLSDNEKAYQRRRIYYTICIFVRLAIAGLMLQYKDKVWLPYLTLIFSIFSIVNLTLYTENETKQWWSNTFQLIISISMLIISILIIMTQFNIIDKDIVPTYLLALLMFISVFGGVFQSLLKPSC